MRIRKKKWTEKELGTNPRLVTPPDSHKGRWNGYFGNNNPIHAEIGCGKGRFITEMAVRHTDISFVALEREVHVIVTGMRASRELEPKPAFVVCDADMIRDVFAPGEVGRIYINFCDPWPRSKWAKRRLTHRGFLEMYKTVLSPSGSVFFKTDNEPLFDFSLAEFAAAGWRLENISRDLHNSGYADNIMTEYEEKFFSLGMPIYRCEAYNI